MVSGGITVPFSIGLTFMTAAAADYFMGSSQQIMRLPECLMSRTQVGEGAPWLDMGH